MRKLIKQKTLKTLSIGLLLSTTLLNFTTLSSSSAYHIDTAETKGAKTSTGDWTFPSSEITALNNGINATETINGNLELQIQANDNIEVSQIHIYADKPSNPGNYSLLDSLNVSSDNINQTFTLSNSLAEDGEYNLYSIAEDWYPNLEEVPTTPPDLIITYDSTAPTTTINPPEASINYTNANLDISITAEDTVSNINSVQYKVQNYANADSCDGNLTEITAYTDMTITSGAIGDQSVEAENILTTGTYSDGCYLVTIKAENQFGLSNEKNFTLTFDTTNPTADAGPDFSISTGTEITLDGSGSSDNIDSNSNLVFDWDFDSDGTYDAFDTGETVKHTFDSSTTVTLKVTDRTGNYSTDSTVITVI